MVLVLLSAMLSADHQSVLKLCIHNSHSLFSCFIQIEVKTRKGISCADPYFSRRGGGCWGGGVQGIFGYLSFPGVGSEAYFQSFYCVNFEFGNSEIWILENWIFQEGGGGQDPPNPSRSAHVYFKCKQYLFCVRHDCLFKTPVLPDE